MGACARPEAPGAKGERAVSQMYLKGSAPPRGMQRLPKPWSPHALSRQRSFSSMKELHEIFHSYRCSMLGEYLQVVWSGHRKLTSKRRTCDATFEQPCT